MQICDILGAVTPYAARIISHTSPWWAAGNNLMVGEDVRKVTIHFEKLMEKRIMEFQTNIFEGVEPPSSSKYNLIGTYNIRGLTLRTEEKL